MKLRIVKLTKDKYQDWNRFCLESDQAWFLHTADWLEYSLNYRPELKTKNLSFFIYWKDKIMAIAPLALETYQDGRKEFSLGGGEILSPVLANELNSKQKEEFLEFIFKEIDRLAGQEKTARVRFRLPSLSSSFLKKNFFLTNYLLRFGYLDISLNTRIIDLRKTEAELWGGLRRNHRRNILKGEEFKVRFYNSKNITREVFEAYKIMHQKAASRQTRPDKTFDLMYYWLEIDWAFLAVVEFQGKQIGFEYYSIYKNYALGFSAANDPDYEKDYPIRHLLEWEAIKWMKNQGILLYEIGLQWYGTLLYDFPDQKQLNISHFKKGFGGFVIPLMAGEKYYQKDYFLEIYQSRIKKYSNYLAQREYE